MSGLPGFIVGWPFRERVAEIRDTRLLASNRRHVVFLGSDELHKGTSAPVLGVGLLAHDSRKGQAAGRSALVVELFMGALCEVAARAPPYQDTVLGFLDALEMSNARADPASDACREMDPVRGDVEHRHEHLVVLVGSLRLLPTARGISATWATGYLEPSYAEVSWSQAFGKGDEKCPRVVSFFRYEAAGKGGHVDK